MGRPEPAAGAADAGSSIPAVELERCTLRDDVAAHASIDPDATAIVTPGRRPLRYGELLAQIDYVIETLNAAGIGRNDPVAIVLPHGPEMILATVAVAACATAAPLNSLYRRSEFDFALADLKVRALIAPRGSELPVVAAARARGLPIIELTAQREAAAGRFTLAAPRRAPPAHGGVAQPGDVAFVLHTSGTTGWPKVVPLTHLNVAHTTRNLIGPRGITSADRCLALLPQFHIGLTSNAVLPLCTGGSIACPDGFDPAKLADVFAELRPTWYGAVPAIHQAVRAQIERAPAAFAGHSLRYVGTGGAPMTVRAMEEFEQLLQVPVVEMYGLTEACGTVSGNALRPGRRKFGSAGIATGQDLAIMDTQGRILPAGQRGEVVLRGPNVMAGYRDDPAATAAAFHGDWLRTGDLGCLDDDGDLWLSGRLKELINRGGEKIAPLEIDEVLSRHPAVAQAVAFALPDVRLGEDVAAAVVLRRDVSTTEEALRAHAAAHLAPFKVPRRIVVVEELRTGPTGKVPRVGLAELLHVPLRQPQTAPAFTAPRTPVEESLARIFAHLLERERVGVDEDFFDLGGDSLMAVTLLGAIEEVFGHTVSVTALFERGTVAGLARELAGHDVVPAQRLLVPVRVGGTARPFVCVHGMWGDVFHLRRLATSIDANVPVHGFRIRGLDGKEPLPTSVEEMAEAYVRELLAFDPAGPYFLGGYSFGGVVAFDMACRLTARGHSVALVALIDSVSPAVARQLGASLRYGRFLRSGAQAGWKWLQPAWLSRQLRVGLRVYRRRAPAHPVAVGADRPPLERFRIIEETTEVAARRYRPPIYPGRITLLRTQENVRKAGNAELGWGALAHGGVETIDVSGRHMQLLEPPFVTEIAAALNRAIAGARLPSATASVSG